MTDKFYITAAIPYVNAKPHIGHALEFTQGDVLARHARAKGIKARYISGADENSLKNVQAAEKEGITVEELCKRNAQAFVDLAKLYNISFDDFVHSSSKEHFASSQELWKLCDAAGDIYKKKYKGLYCVGCEQFYTPDELNENGECFEHPGKKLDEIEEENYFFRLSKYQEQLIKILESDEYAIVPAHRKNEALSFIKRGLEDFSISRSVARAHGWGVPVPGDPTQIMYVWFDALNVYRSAVEHEQEEWWPADTHLIGKGIIRFHAVYWPAMLLSAKLPLPKKLLVHGYVTIDGQKMSKSLGNTIDPAELVKKYGVDPVRYYLLKEIPSGEDGDWNDEKFRALYNGDLANGLGNFTSRVLALGTALTESGTAHAEIDKRIKEAQQAVEEKLGEFKLHEALHAIWDLVRFGDKYVNENKVWAIEDESQKTKAVHNLVVVLYNVAQMLEPFLPETAAKILACVVWNGGKPQIKKAGMLFPRLG